MITHLDQRLLRLEIMVGVTLVGVISLVIKAYAP
jgi:hypothetical protein